MRTSTLFLVSYQVAALFAGASAFTTPTSLTAPKAAASCLFSTEAPAEPAAEAEEAVVDDGMIPTNLPSDCGMDYVPLATMLATGQFEEADQVRCALVTKERLFSPRINRLGVDGRHSPSIYLTFNLYYLQSPTVHTRCFDCYFRCQGGGT